MIWAFKIMIRGINYARMCPKVHMNSLCSQRITFWDVWFILAYAPGLNCLSSRNLKELLKWKRFMEIPPQSFGMYLTGHPFQIVITGQKKKKPTMNVTTETKQWSSFPWHWTQICVLVIMTNCPMLLLQELFPVTLGNAVYLLSFIFALGKIFFI